MKLWIFIPLLILSGCLVGPDYIPPEMPIPDAWSSQTVPDAVCVALNDEPPIAWWELFEDPLLNQYINMAASHNNDVLAAESRIFQAHAVRKVAASSLYPHISADFNALHLYFSKNGPFFGNMPAGLAPGIPFPSLIPENFNLYNALIDVSWEIDLFGKIRRSVEAADAQIGEAIEQRNGILISVLAEVAINYIELRSNQQRGLLLQDNVVLLEKNAEIVAKQLETGYASQFDVELVQASLTEAIATLPPLLAQIYQNIYALSLLTGHLPEALLEELLPIQPLPPLPCQVAAGIRSELLRRRPDIRQAERQLAEATANIGVAVASFFPSFNLLGGVGFQSLHLSNLFQGRSLTWGIDGGLTLPIYQGGKLVGNLLSSEAQASAVWFNYQQTVLNALQEVESNLVAYAEQLQASKELSEATQHYGQLVFLTENRYSKGLISLLNVLQIQQQANNTALNLLSSDTTAFINLISLYKALGGGWQTCQ